LARWFKNFFSKENLGFWRLVRVFFAVLRLGLHIRSKNNSFFTLVWPIGSKFFSRDLEKLQFFVVVKRVKKN